MADLTPIEGASILRLLPGALQQSVETEQAIAILDLEADLKSDIFLKGKRADGSQIGNYGTDPSYVSISASKERYGAQLPLSRMTGKGKDPRSKSKFMNGNPRKSRYFSDGYKGFRDYVGRATDKVNLDLTGGLQNSIASGTSENVSVIQFLTEENRDLSGYLEDKYGGTLEGPVIFKPSETAKKRFFDRLKNAAIETLNNVLR